MQGYDFRDAEMTFYYFHLGIWWYFCLQNMHMILTRFWMG